MVLSVGENIPSFSAMSTEGSPVSAADLKGQWVVLYFYPKDDTPGCTKEACGFRDMKAEYDKRDTIVYGVSPDSIESHQKFIEKHSLNFALLVDEDLKMARSFGILKENNGVKRTTFILDMQGKIIKIFENVKVEGHNQEVLDYLDIVQGTVM